MKFPTIVVAFVSFCLVSSYSKPAFAAVIDAGDTPASAAIVEVTTRDETSGGPGRHHRRTLASKKNPPAAAAAVAALGVGVGDDCYDEFGSNENDCFMKGTWCHWYDYWRDGACSSKPGVDCGGHFRAPDCDGCLYYRKRKLNYCNGECKMHYTWFWDKLVGKNDYCEPI